MHRYNEERIKMSFGGKRLLEYKRSLGIALSPRNSPHLQIFFQWVKIIRMFSCNFTFRIK